MAARAGPSRIREPGGRRSSARSGRCGPPTMRTSSRSRPTATGRPSCRSTRAARRPGRRSRSSTAGRPRRPRSWRPPPASAAGRSAASRRRSGWSVTSPPSPPATCWYLSTWEWLGLRLTGVASAPFVPDQAIPDVALVAAAGIPSDRLPPPSPSGEIIGRLTDTRRRRPRSAPRDPGRRRHGRRIRQLPRRRAARAGRCLRSGRVGRRLWRVLGPAARGRRRVRDAGTAGRPVQRRGRDGHDRSGARLVSRRHPRRHDHDRGAARRGGRHPARRRRPRLPPVPGRRAFADLGSRGPRACWPA